MSSNTSTGLPEIFEIQQTNEWRHLNDAIRIANHALKYNETLHVHLMNVLNAVTFISDFHRSNMLSDRFGSN